MAQSKPSVTIRRDAEEVKRYRRRLKIIPIIVIILLLALIIGYVISVLYMRFGAFTVMVNKFDMLDYALTLSETPEFSSYSSRLNAEIYERVTNIDGRTLPDYLDNKVFAGAKASTLMADEKDIAGFDAFLARYKKALPLEKAAIEVL